MREAGVRHVDGAMRAAPVMGREALAIAQIKKAPA
jgi:hypothetical protein